jgi:hypothetical protein
MPPQRVVSRPKGTKASAGRAGTRSRGKSKPVNEDEEKTYTPSLKVVLKLRKGSNPEPNNNELRSTRGRPVKRTVNYQEGMDILMNDNVDESSNDTSITSPKAKTAKTVKSKSNASMESQAEEMISNLSDFGTQSQAVEAPRVPSFEETVHKDIIQLFDSLAEQPEIQMELQDITRPNPDPLLKDHEDYDIVQPWTSKHLFHLYTLAHIRNNYDICDLIADTWIRQFQAMDANDNTKIWQENRSSYIQERFATAPHSDNGYPNLADYAMRFDIQRICELYENTESDCGGRQVWADAMALCGKGLEGQLKKAGNCMDLDKWPVQLVKDVFQVTLRSMRIRLTLKIEEPHPEEWCERYHEHPKYGAKCYRQVYKEQEAAKAAREASESVEDADGMDIDPVDGGDGGKHVTFAETV